MTDTPKRRRAPSAARKLKEALEALRLAEANAAENAALLMKAREDVSRLTEKIARLEASREFYERACAEKDMEVAQVHTLLDVLPGAVPRGTLVGDNCDRPIRLMTRLAAWLAVRK